MEENAGTAAAALEAWQQVRAMLDDLTKTIRADAENELELLEGLRVLARATALCSELSVDVDPQRPFFFNMNTPLRYIGGPNPDGEYHLGMIDGVHRYRVRGQRGTSRYLGFQVLAGRGMTPRRQAAYVSDRDLPLASDGIFELVLSQEEPSPAELGSAKWVGIPEDASGIVVRQYIADRATEEPASYSIEALEPAEPPAPISDDGLAMQLTAMAWTIWKLTTLHRTVMPELLGSPNQLATSVAAALGSENTTPDNLYMIGTFRLEAGQALVIDAVPPDTRYWNLTLENIWHECIDVRRRRTSITNAGAERRSDGTVRIVIAAADPLVPNWLDTGGRHRGFMTFRWLDNPVAPQVRTQMVRLTDVVSLA